jgi:hypothetical protein
MSTASIRDAIEKTSRAIAEQPEKARSKNVPATARLLEGLRCEVKGPNGETVHTAMPPAIGGAASAPAPGWLLGLKLSTLEVTVESHSDSRGLLGLDEKVSAGLSSIATRVRIGAKGVSADQLRALAEWGDHHSPVACTARSAPSYALEVEVV